MHEKLFLCEFENSVNMHERSYCTNSPIQLICMHDEKLLCEFRIQSTCMHEIKKKLLFQFEIRLTCMKSYCVNLKFSQHACEKFEFSPIMHDEKLLCEFPIQLTCMKKSYCVNLTCIRTLLCTSLNSVNMHEKLLCVCEFEFSQHAYEKLLCTSLNSFNMHKNPIVHEFWIQSTCIWEAIVRIGIWSICIMRRSLYYCTNSNSVITCMRKAIHSSVNSNSVNMHHKKLLYELEIHSVSICIKEPIV